MFVYFIAGKIVMVQNITADLLFISNQNGVCHRQPGCCNNKVILNYCQDICGLSSGFKACTVCTL